MKSVILLRHANIDSAGPGPTPDTLPLNAAGIKRAQDLVHVAGSASVTAVFASQALRTQLTVQPLCTRLGLQFKVLPTISQLAQAVRSEQTGKVVLIAGHSNTVPQLINALGAPFPEPIIDGFDNLFVVTLNDSGPSSVTRLKYGDPTP